MIDDFFFDGIREVRFNKNRKGPLSPDYRPLYKIAQILLLLSCSRKKQSTLLRIQVFNYALKTVDDEDLLGQMISNGKLSIVRFDPSVNRALMFARGAGFIKITGNRKFQLTETGLEFIGNMTTEDIGFMKFEKQMFDKYGKTISDSLIDRVLKERIEKW